MGPAASSSPPFAREMPKRKASAEEGAQEAAGQFAPPEGALHLYSNRDFWEARYKKESEEAAAGGCGGSAEKALFEWYAPWSSVRELVEDYAPRDGVVLELGCGSSTLARDMAADGYEDVLAVDFAEAAVQASIAQARALMKKQATERGALAATGRDAADAMRGLRFERMDARELDLPAVSVDTVIDKATIDAILCASDGTENVLQVAAEVDRVLRPGGAFIVISHIDPDGEGEEGEEESESGGGDSTRPEALGLVCGLGWLTDAVLPAFDWVQSRWTVDVHSIRGHGDMPHIYVLTKIARKVTRSASRGSMDDVQVELHEH